MKFKKTLFGGDVQLNVIKQIQVFIALIIIGYFGVKVVYGIFFGFYSQKFYNRDVSITTNEQNDSSGGSIPITQTVTLDAYMPGMWNNEMTDFISTLVLTFVIFIFTNLSEKSMINEYGNINFVFLLGYILGLGYPPIYNNYINLFSEEFNSSCTIKYIYLILLVGFIVFIVTLNYKSAKQVESVHKMNYIIYVVAIILLLFGLVFSKKNSSSYNNVSYAYSDEKGCSSKTTIQNGIIQSSGDLINITAPFVSFILLLFFSYEPDQIGMKNLYIFIYAILLGILVSSVSYYGIEFFLVRKPQTQCDDIANCNLTDYVDLSKNTTSEPIGLITDSNVLKKNTMMNNIGFISWFKIALVILILVISIYLIYYFLKKSAK